MNFGYSYMHTETPGRMKFTLHRHDNYELYLFLKGDCEYIVEGVTYPLNPNDLIIINDSELHRVRHKSESPYERRVININRHFFEEMNCPELEKVFTDKRNGKNSKLDRSLVETSGLLDAFARLGKYHDRTPENSAILNAVLVEILYLLNNIDINSRDAENSRISEIADYINQNLGEALTLDSIADRFFISKYYLCRIFKAETGLTINRYIAMKRTMLVKKYCDSGMSISRACMEAGFASYSTFYRAYVKEYGKKPKDEFKRR